MAIKFEKEIEAVLGWKPDLRDEGSVQNLNDMPASVVEHAKRLPNLWRDAFVSFYVNAQDRRFVREFIQEVIVPGHDVSSWRRGRILVPEFSPRALVQHSVDEILAGLRPAGSLPWRRLRPDRKLWNDREYVTGAPAVMCSELDYRFVPGPNVRDLLPTGVELDAVDDEHIATRRWIAANIARVAESRAIRDATDPQHLIFGCFADLERVSPDALVAARGLLQELATLPSTTEYVPGFRGPDEWYRSGKPELAA